MPTYNTAPSVIVQENDRSEYGVTATTNNAGAYVGNFLWGAIGSAERISNVSKLESFFGKPKKFNSQDFHTAKRFLEVNGNLFVGRYDSSDLANAHNDITVSNVAINNYISDPFVIDLTNSGSLQTTKDQAKNIINSLTYTHDNLKSIYNTVVQSQTYEPNIAIIIDRARQQDAKRNRTIAEINNLNYTGIYPISNDDIKASKAKYVDFIKQLETVSQNVFNFYVSDVVIDFDRMLAQRSILDTDGLSSIVDSSVIDYYKNQFDTAPNQKVIADVYNNANNTIKVKNEYIQKIKDDNTDLNASRKNVYTQYITKCADGAESYIFSLVEKEIATDIEQTPAPELVNNEFWNKRNTPLLLSPNLYSDYNYISENLTNENDVFKIKIKNENDFQVKTDIPLNVYFIARYPSSLGNGIIVSVADSSTFENWEYKKHFRSAPNTSSYTQYNGGSNDEIHVIVIDKAGNFGIKGGILEIYPFLSKSVNGKNEDGISNYYIDYINNYSRYVYCSNKFVSSQYNTLPLPRKLTESQLINVFKRASLFFKGNEVNDYALEISEHLDANATERCQYYIDEFEGRHGITSLNLLYKMHDTPTATVPENINLKDLYDSISEMIYKIRNLNKSKVTAEFFECVKKLDIEFILRDTDYIQVQLRNHANEYDIDLKNYYEQVNFGIGLEAEGTKFGDLVNAIDYAETQHTFELIGGTDAKNVTDSEKVASWSFMNDKNKYDPFVVVAGAVSSVVANNIASIFINRADAITFTSPCDINSGAPILGADSIAEEKILNYRKGIVSQSYICMDSAYEYVIDVYNDGYVWVPCCAVNAGNYSLHDCWLAPAGYTRGIHNGVIKISTNPDTNMIANLYRYGINSMVTDKKGTTLLLGDKNLQEKDSQLDRISARGTLIMIEKDIANAAKYSLFENNNIYTQEAFKNRVTPYLEHLKGENGIADFRVKCDDTNNTEEVKLAHEFVGDIYLKFESSINWVKINFNILAKMTQVTETNNTQL